jgi:endonuclease YncB( thermonuclease family)
MNCPVSANTNAFALKMKDGRVLKFDDVGNSRASEALKTKTKWTTAASNNKPVKAKVSGMVTGDTITVMSID